MADVVPIAQAVLLKFPVSSIPFNTEADADVLMKWLVDRVIWSKTRIETTAQSLGWSTADVKRHLANATPTLEALAKVLGWPDPRTRNAAEFAAKDGRLDFWMENEHGPSVMLSDRSRREMARPVKIRSSDEESVARITYVRVGKEDKPTKRKRTGSTMLESDLLARGEGVSLDHLISKGGREGRSGYYAPSEPVGSVTEKQAEDNREKRYGAYVPPGDLEPLDLMVAIEELEAYRCSKDVDRATLEARVELHASRQMAHISVGQPWVSADWDRPIGSDAPDGTYRHGNWSLPEHKPGEVCPQCQGRPLAKLEYCRCDRSGMDHLLTPGEPIGRPTRGKAKPKPGLAVHNPDQLTGPARDSEKKSRKSG